MDANPILAETIRGNWVENRHRGAYVVVDADGTIIASAGDIDRPIFPRSAIKAMQALPIFARQADEQFHHTSEELALACASHHGEDVHVATAEGLLTRIGLSVADLECGAHAPTNAAARDALRASGKEPSALHNNCSGKHSGMLSVALAMGIPTAGYVSRDHEVQRAVREAVEAVIGEKLSEGKCGTDGCSIPTYAAPLQSFAYGFARMATGRGLSPELAQAAQRFYQQARIPVMNNVATGSIITQQFASQPENYIFRNSASDQIQAAMIVQEAVDRRKFKKVAILADSTNYGQLGRADLEKVLTTKGIKPVVVEKYNLQDVDMTAQLLKAKQAGAEVVLTYGIGPELAQIANGMEKLGWKVPLIGSWTLAMANFIDNAGKNGEGTRMPQTFIQDANTPRRKAFIDAYVKAYNPPNGRMPSAVSAAQGYDSIYLLAAAIKQAGGTEGPKVLAALENLNEKVEGVVTTYNKPYSKTDHEAITFDNTHFGEVKAGRVTLAAGSAAK